MITETLLIFGLIKKWENSWVLTRKGQINYSGSDPSFWQKECRKPLNLQEVKGNLLNAGFDISDLEVSKL